MSGVAGSRKVSPRIEWLIDVDRAALKVDGLIRVEGYVQSGRPMQEVATMEKAAHYGAHSVLFEAASDGSNSVAQAFVFVTKAVDDDPAFAELHQRLWSWGGVPILYRRAPGVVQMFRCGHRPDFVKGGRRIFKPFDILKIGADVGEIEAWWDAELIRNGTLWDDPDMAARLLSKDSAAHLRLVAAVKAMNKRLAESKLLSARLRRRLLILSLLIAYLDQRKALPNDFFASCLPGASGLPAVLADSTALLDMLSRLEVLFNGGVFKLDERDRVEITTSPELGHFSRLIEAKEEMSGQLSLWELYSFRDLPVEVISHIYELFVTDPAVSVYTPPALVRLILDETLTDERIDRIIDNEETVLDPACGSGIFLVEAFKRVILRWRKRNGWKSPDVDTLRSLVQRMRGVDLDAGAVELATFSLYLALCDALAPEVIRSTPQLFPPLRGEGLIESCFFAAKKKGLFSGKIGVIVGNPPFKSKLDTLGAQDAYAEYVKEHGKLPDLQVAYLFLHESMKLLMPGGVLAMLQQYNLLYNEKPDFRRIFFNTWHVREVLDFVSIRGLFSKDTKVVTVVALAEPAPLVGTLLHAVFRRSARAEAGFRFDIDYYDLHRVPRKAILSDMTPDIWRANLLGGGRTYALVRRLRAMPTLELHATSKNWDFGEGFIEGDSGVSRQADHLYDQPLLPSDALTTNGVDFKRITVVDRKPIEGPRTEKRFTSPMLLIREHADLPHVLWRKGYMTYKNKIVGFAANDVFELEAVEKWLKADPVGLRAYAAIISVRMFSQKATTLSCTDIYNLPFDPNAEDLSLSPNERLVATDVVDHYLEFVRRGSSSKLAEHDGRDGVVRFAQHFVAQINAFYLRKPLRFVGYADFGGTLCAGFVFGGGEIDWSGTEQLRHRLDDLLRERRATSLTTTRIARIYDGDAIYLLKPSRLRYWLPSTALRDSDDTLSDLRSQGF